MCIAAIRSRDNLAKPASSVSFRSTSSSPRTRSTGGNSRSAVLTGSSRPVRRRMAKRSALILPMP